MRQDASNHYTFVMDSDEDIDAVPPEAELRLVSGRSTTVRAASSQGRRSIGDMWRMSRTLADPRFDILLFPTVYSFVPVFSRAKKVIMIHDVIAEQFPDLTLPRRATRWFWKAKVALGRWQASALVTVSEHARQGIVEHFKIEPANVHVVGEASDPIFRVIENAAPSERLESLGIAATTRSVVYVGGFGPHKNLELLVDVFAKLVRDERFNDVQLIMVGEYAKEVFHSYFTTIRRQVDELNLSNSVVFTGFLPDEELVVLLNRATVLVLPSLLEGFGLPAIEAAACGLPVLATTASPLPDLLGEGGLFIDPNDVTGWEDALRRVLECEGLRERMREAGLVAAGRLSWQAAARQLIRVFEQVAA